MDLASTGSNISKYKLDTAAKVTLKEKIEDNEMSKKEEKTENVKNTQTIQKQEQSEQNKEKTVISKIIYFGKV